MFQINFEPAFENMVDYIREKEMKNDPKRVSIWVKKDWKLDASNNGGVRLRFPLMYHIEATKKEAYRYCPQFTVYLGWDGSPAPVNKGAILGSIETKTAAQLLTHKNESTRIFAKEVLAQDPAYVQEFDSDKYFIEKTDLKKALKELYPSMIFSKSYNQYKLSNDIYDLELWVDIKKVQKDVILKEFADLVAKATRTTAFEYSKIRIVKYNIDDYEYNYYSTTGSRLTRIFQCASSHSSTPNSHEFIEKYIEANEELYSLEKKVEKQANSTTRAVSAITGNKTLEISFRFDLNSLMEGPSNLTIRNQYDYRYYKNILIEDFNSLKEVIEKALKEKIFMKEPNEYFTWFEEEATK